MRCRLVLPKRNVIAETGSVFDLAHLARFFHSAIPSELTLGLSPGLLGTVPAEQRIGGFDVTRDLRGHTNADVAATHFGKSDGAVAAILFVGEAALAFANFGDGSAEVTIPLQSIHGQIKMRVENQ